MNNKITSQRFKNFISYDFWKMVIAIVAVIIVVGLTMRITTPSPTYAQEFTLMVDSAIITGDEGRNLLNDVDGRDVSNYGFSYDILRTKSYYLTTGQHSPSFLMHTYKKAYQDDAFICADADENSLYKSYVSNFYGVELTSYVDQAISFANEFYAQNGQLDEQKVKDYFASKRGKDVRFISDTDYFNAVNNECLRITAIKENATKLKQIFSTYDILYKYEQLESFGEIVEEGYYAIDFSKLNVYKRQDKNLMNAFSRIRDLGDGNYESTLENVLLLVGNNYEASNDLHYEGLAVINTIIKTYTTLLD
ncbi:MAG: hypothetical protein IJW26_05180 [Clostridia bacterium]|nr:hypothetical protein [Clostridia bacterium]